MKNTINMSVLILCLLVAGFTSLGVTYWNRGDDPVYEVHEDTLSLVLGTNTRDSTAVFPGGKYMQIGLFPGQQYSGSTDSFAYHKDSTIVQVQVRGWADKKRTHLLWKQNVWTTFNMQKSPKRHFYLDNSDSATARIYAYGSNPYAAYTAGTGTWDSTRIDLRTLQNEVFKTALGVDMAPWIDVAVEDSVVPKGTTNTPGWKGKVYVIVGN